MAICEGRWDGTGCGSAGIYGRFVDGPGCGRPRPGNVRFQLTDDAPAITAPERLAEAQAGAEWACAHCGATSRATPQACGGCGAPRGSLPGRATIDHAVKDVPRSGDVSSADSPPRAQARSAEARARAGRSHPGGGDGCGPRIARARHARRGLRTRGGDERGTAAAAAQAARLRRRRAGGAGGDRVRVGVDHGAGAVGAAGAGHRAAEGVDAGDHPRARHGRGGKRMDPRRPRRQPSRAPSRASTTFRCWCATTPPGARRRTWCRCPTATSGTRRPSPNR